LGREQAFVLAAASLRQALQNMPELTEASKHVVVETTKQGLNIDIVDQDGSAMFPPDSKEPYDRSRRLIQAIAGPLKDTPYRIAITGHTAGSETSLQSDGQWNLSTDRANTVRRILAAEGYPSVRIATCSRGFGGWCAEAGLELFKRCADA
jgi:chemotaxis protein MotB